MSRKIKISVTVSWMTPKGGKVEGVRNTSVIELHPDDVRDTLLVVGADTEHSFRRKLALYDEDHNND